MAEEYNNAIILLADKVQITLQFVKQGEKQPYLSLTNGQGIILVAGYINKNVG